MATYDFYQNTYLGSLLDQAAFERSVARAEAYIVRLEHCFQVTPYGPDGRAMAVCAVAEHLAREEEDPRIQSASVGNTSVRYFENSHKRLQRALLQAVSVYLDIRRGVD